MKSATANPIEESNVLNRLEHWYQSMCNGDWEHTYGVKVETLDNPGWMVTIEVRDTSLFKIPFPTVRIDRSETDWIQCEVTDGIFCGTGGVGQLNSILLRFLEWAEANR